MDDIHFKDIRVLPTALDLKSNAKQNLAEILNQLQTGSVLKGFVVGNTPKGEAIFHTAYGRFVAPNQQGLVRGDKITIRISGNSPNLQGAVVSVNDQNVGNPEIVNLSELKLSNPPVPQKSSNATNVRLENVENIPKIITGQITYLNLSKISKESVLYKELIKLDTQTLAPNIIFKVGTKQGNVSAALVVEAEISSQTNKNNAQLIKTEFGVITAENSKIPIGKKLCLEIISLDNRPTNVNIAKNVSEFVLNISKNWSSLQGLKILTSVDSKLPDNNKQISVLGAGLADKAKGDSLSIQSTQKGVMSASLPGKGGVPIENQIKSGAPTNNLAATNINSENNRPVSNLSFGNNQFIANANIQPIYSPGRLKKPDLKTENEKKSSAAISKDHSGSGEKVKDLASPRQWHDPANLNKMIKMLGSSIEEIKKITQEYSSVKELLVPNIRLEENNSKWQTVFIPFFNGQKVEEREVKINRSRDHYLRFVLDMELEDVGVLQLDGLIQFKANSKTPINFDMVLRSNGKFDPVVRSKITEIFLNSKDINGIGGQMQFEETGVMVNTSNLS